MYVKSIELENYKSFWLPQTIYLAPGFNLFVGANNAGKTTMLEVLDLNAGNTIPHRSVANMPEYGASPAPQSRFRVLLATNLAEYRGFSTTSLYIPIPNDLLNRLSSNGNDAARQAYKEISASSDMGITFDLQGGIERAVYETCFGKAEAVTLNAPTDPICAVNIDFSPVDGTIQSAQIANFSGIGSELGQIRDRYRSRIYRFSAQRLPADTSHAAGDPILQRNAGNLPYCINHLHSSDAEGHRILCRWVHRIFPSVKWIQAPPIPGSQTFQLQCLPEAPEARRSDLAVSLDRMGSGIGNVIAILYVVLTARYPQVIAIDEPNSFLHPKALRELLSILAQEGKQHQYILTAHSPDVLTAVSPATITLFELNDTFTVTKQASGKDLPLLRTELAQLGIRMTDLHGRDRVLWVEGQTEEIILPELLQHFCPEVSAGTAVLRVEHTGAFEKKGLSPTEVAKIYQRLTESSALVPPMVAILLDKESRKKNECARISKDSAGVIHFLDRTMLENYVLHADAISAVLSELGEDVSVDAVSAELFSVSGENSHVVHGAQLLTGLFSKLSEARLEFRKTRDTPQLIRWLLANRPAALAEIEVFLRQLFGLPSREKDS
jgi:hypothetical protein